MPLANVDGLDIFYESHGDPEAPTCLLVMGLGGQMTSWPDGLIAELIERGFRVVSFDNREVGLSTASAGDPPDIMALLAANAAGEPLETPYSLSEMAADAIGLLDHLGIEEAHVAGVSMGGMIVQMMAIEAPTRVASMTSIMSTTGADDVGQPDPSAFDALLAPTPTGRDAVIAHDVEVGRVIGGPLFSADEATERAVASYDRSYRPHASAFQLAAIGKTGDRTSRLANVSCPTMVIHGRVDNLIALSGGYATAEAIEGADLLVLSRMGHDLPAVYWPQIADGIKSVAVRSESSDS